ncbi:hypothetical protein WA026_008564 [Henosepilachna vigintioctopunctata]|uniref:THAP-type domain-containing protein n=1 Tax=Henosepilachna vigintioctopunctata TaxID=420089 RepID=A0AAW1UAT3_9CUCU
MTRFSKSEVNFASKSRKQVLKGDYIKGNITMKNKSTNTEIPSNVKEESCEALKDETWKIKSKLHKKRMYKCCVPLCLSYGPEENFIPFPSFDSQQRLDWINKIPRRNWVICHNTVICRNHFTQNGIYTACEDPIVPKCAPTVFPDAPLFSNLEYKYRKIDPGMLQTSPSYTLPETFGDLERLPNFEDFIFNFFMLKSNYKEKLNNEIDADRWHAHESANYVLFYQLDIFNYAPSISVSILINENMKVVVSLDGIVMDPLDYTRHIPVNGTITHWNQLRNMMWDFGRESKKKEEAQELLAEKVADNVDIEKI